MYNNSIDPEIILLNNRPLPQFLGLSPNEVYPLLHDPFNEDCPVLLRKELANETLDCVPFFRVVEDLLAITQREGKLKQTPLGFLQKKVAIWPIQVSNA